MANIKKINELPAGQNPENSSLLAAYNTSSGLTEKITVNQLFDFVSDDFRFDPNRLGGYNTGEIVTFGSPRQLFESLVDNNEQTPQNDGINWTLVESVEESVEWSAGIYSAPSIRIFNGSLYYLPSTTTFPYNSVDNPQVDNSWNSVSAGSTAVGTSFDDTNTKVAKGTNLQEFSESVDSALLNTRTTGITYGGDVTVSGTTTFNVTAGVGQILDNTNPASPVYSNVIGKAGTNVPVANIANRRVYIYWDANGDIQQQLTAPTRGEYRRKLFLGRVTSNGTSLIADADDLTPIQQDANQIRDLAEFIGTIKKGLEISPNANLTFARTAGEFFDFGTNFHQNALDPHVRTIASVNPASFLLYKRDGFISSGNTNVPVNQYDVGGTLTTITNNRFVNHRVYGFQNGDVVIQYGQNQYNSKTEAVNAISTAPFIKSSDLATGILLAVITFVKGENNLTNSTITLTNQFGGIGGGVGASVAGAYLQILNNLSDVDNPDTARANIGAAALNDYNLLTGQQSFDSFLSFNSSTLRTGGTLVDDFPFLGTLLVLNSGSTSDLIINSVAPLITIFDNDSKNRVLIIRNDSDNNHNIIINNIGSGTATNKFYIGKNLTIPPKSGAVFMYRDEATGQDGWTLVAKSSSLEDYPIDSTGSVVNYDRPRTYGTSAAPITTATLTDSNTSAQRVIQKIYHQAASFTPPASWVKLGASADYAAGSLNIIYVEYQTATRKEYSITQ